MINAIVGRPRTGKSYEAVRYHIVPAILKDKRKVVTNVSVNKEYIQKVHGEEVANLIHVIDGQFSEYGQVRPFAHEQDFLQFDDWKNEKGQGALFVIDEAHLSAGRNARPQLIEYFSMHGHYGHDILVLTQNARKLNRDLKDMIEIVWRTTKLSAYGKDDTYLQKTHHGVDNMRDAIHQEERKYDPEFFPYYKSHTQSKGSVLEATAKEVHTKLNPFATVSKAMIGIGVLWVGGILFYEFSDDEKEPGNLSDVVAVEEVKEPVTQLERFKVEAQESGAEPYVKPERSKTRNEEIAEKMRERSKQYHPYHKVQLHVDGHYTDNATGESVVYFSASTNGQRLFDLRLKDFFLAGYTVQVLTECMVKITYFEYEDFLTCDVPSVGMSTGLAKNT